MRWRSDPPIYSAEYAYYPANLDDGTTGFTIIHIEDSLEQELRVKEYHDADNEVRHYPSVHPDVIHTMINDNGPSVLTLKSGRGYMLSSTLRNIENLEPAPMLLGIGGGKGERPLVVSYYGHMVRPDVSGAGRLVSATTNGESTVAYHTGDIGTGSE